MGSGNLDFPVDEKISSTSKNPVQNKVVKVYIDHIETAHKGYYASFESLVELYPSPKIGSRAYVGETYPYDIYVYGKDGWVKTGELQNEEVPNIDDLLTNALEPYVLDSSLNDKVKSIKVDNAITADNTNKLGGKTPEAYVLDASLADKVKVVKVNNATNADEAGMLNGHVCMV